jgi:hypothetical protein
MKLLGAVLLGSAFLIAVPALAQERNDNRSNGQDNMSRTDDQNSHRDAQDSSRNDAQDSMNRQASHRPVSRRVTYHRNNKSNDDEHQQTEQLNRQYRGVTSDAR